MNAFSLVIVLGVIASSSAGLITPVVSTYGAVASQPLLTTVVSRGHGLEGQYVPDNVEKIYDDGSYKPEVSPLPLTVSPYGLVPAGSGLEGQYVRDNIETLYDDGSYKSEISPLPLSPSPYGLVPSGSGLEGQYVPDLTEKLFDDGSYRPVGTVRIAYL